MVVGEIIYSDFLEVFQNIQRTGDNSFIASELRPTKKTLDKYKSVLLNEKTESEHPLISHLALTDTGSWS